MKLIAMTLASLSLFASSAAQADPTKAREDVRAVAPALEKYRQDTLFGDLWKRPGLNLRDRSIVTLAALITRNQTAEMPHYLNFALDNGVKPSEVSEIVTHLAFYAGWGNAIAAVAVVKDVFAAHKIAADQLPPASPKLLALNEAAEADRAKRVGDLFGAVFPGVTRRSPDPSRLLCRLAQRVFGDAGGEGRVRKTPALIHSRTHTEEERNCHE